jgi:hypothetical protein
MLVTLRGKGGWRKPEIGRGSADATCPVTALQTWQSPASATGRCSGGLPGQGRRSGPDRLHDLEIARLVKRAALAGGVCANLSEGNPQGN